MALLKNPTEITDVPILIGMVYGSPGVGKTTLSLSAPNPVLIDADNGMRRVQKRFQVPSLPMTSYTEVLELFDGHELDPFDTIIIDTTGRLIERIGAYLASDNPAYRQKDGSLSMKGYGRLKDAFQQLLIKAKDRRKHLIFVAHDREERDGDTRIVRPDMGPGSSGRDLIKDLDFIGYMEMRGNERTISFSPCERFYAKNAMELPDLIRVPDTGGGNTFIRDYLVARAIERQKSDEEENQKYGELLVVLEGIVASAKTPPSADKALEEIRKATVIWDSQRIARHNLNKRIKALGMIYDKDAGRFAKLENPKEEVETEAADSEETTEEPNTAQETGDAVLTNALSNPRARSIPLPNQAK